jgi:hypothetical protein
VDLKGVVCHGAADALDLPEVQQVVARVQPEEVLEALVAALNVYPDPFQIGRRRTLHELQVRPPKYGK